MTDHKTLFIGGEQIPASSTERIEIRSATTEEVVGTAPCADNVDVDAAVAAARRAFEDPGGWSAWSVEDRASAIERLADEVAARADRITHFVSSQNGMPTVIAGPLESDMPVKIYRYYADLIRRTELEETRPGLLCGRAIVRRAPIGVIAAIVPWNYPNLITAIKSAPALAAGCTVVLKPSPETVLDSYVFAEAVAAAGNVAAATRALSGVGGLRSLGGPLHRRRTSWGTSRSR